MLQVPGLDALVIQSIQSQIQTLTEVDDRVIIVPKIKSIYKPSTNLSSSTPFAGGGEVCDESCSSSISSKSYKSSRSRSISISDSSSISSKSSLPSVSTDADSDDEDSLSSYHTDIPRLFQERIPVNYSEKERTRMDKNRRIFMLQLELLENLQTYENQQSVALTLVRTFKQRSKVIQLVIGKTQSGKTGCMVEFVKAYIDDEPTPVENIFIITGLSSTDWIEQTKERFPEMMHARIFHNSDIRTKFKDAVSGKQNVVILIDEVQMAAQTEQTINRIFKELGWNLDFMMENDIKLVQFSATPDGLLYALHRSKWPKENYSVHTMQPGMGYYGAHAMMEEGKIKQYADICGKNRDGDIYVDDMEEIYENIGAILHDILSFREPKHNIIRVLGGTEGFVKENIAHTIQTRLSAKEQARFSKEFDEYMMCGNIIDINKYISNKPRLHSFVLIKEKMKCANTINIKYNIGVVVERWNQRVGDGIANDSFVIQGLLGRCCGYGRHDIICYTNVESVVKNERLFDSGFSEEVLSQTCWNSNTTVGNKSGTKPKRTYIDAEELLGANDDAEAEREADKARKAAEKEKKRLEKEAEKSKKDILKTEKEQKRREKEAKKEARNARVTVTAHFPCEPTKESFQKAKVVAIKHLEDDGCTGIPNFQFPFKEQAPNGKYVCYIRGDPKVRTREEVVYEAKCGLGDDKIKYRLTACYQGDQCGFVIRYEK